MSFAAGARRMAETAPTLTDEVLPERPLRQWVLSLPHALRFLPARDPDALMLMLGAEPERALPNAVSGWRVSGRWRGSASVPRGGGPGANDLQGLVERIAASVGQVLERRGLIERDIESAWLSPGAEPGPLDDLLGHSITYRIAVDARAGQKLFTLHTVAPRLQGLEGDPNGVTGWRVWLREIVDTFGVVVVIGFQRRNQHLLKSKS